MGFIINHVKVFSVQSYVLRLFGIWPGSDTTFRPSQLFVACINIACIMFVISCEGRFTVNSSDLRSLIGNAFVVGTRGLAMVKVSILIWKRKELQQLTRNLVELIASNTDPISKQINRRMTKLEFRCTVGLLSIFEAALLATLAAPILKWLISGQNLWELPFLLKTPYVHERTLVYQVTYIIVSYSAFLISIVTPAMDGLFSGFCVYISGQFDIVACKIENLVDWDEPETFTDLQNQKLKEGLAEVIAQHNKCIETSGDLVKFFNQIIFGQFVVTALLLALASVALILAINWAEQVMYGNCVLAAIMQVFLYCKSGSLITNSFGNVATVAYNFPWYKCDKGVRVMIQQIMIRAQEEYVISAPFVVVSMETFTTIVNSTGSLITLMKSFLEA